MIGSVGKRARAYATNGPRKGIGPGRSRHVGEIGRGQAEFTNRSAALLFSRHGTRRAHKDYRSRKKGGETALTVHCLGCYHQAVKRFEESKLWNDMIFVNVPQHRRLLCSQCGSRNAKVMPIFPPAERTPGYREA